MYGYPGMRSLALPIRAFIGVDRLREVLRFHGIAAYRPLRYAVADSMGGYVDAA